MESPTSRTLTGRFVCPVVAGNGRERYIAGAGAAVVDPNGQYDASIDNVNVRCGDGVHFSASGGIYVGLRLLPDLVALGQSHAVSSPGGVWPGALPPSIPSWFPSLPCQ